MIHVHFLLNEVREGTPVLFANGRPGIVCIYPQSR